MVESAYKVDSEHASHKRAGKFRLINELISDFAYSVFVDGNGTIDIEWLSGSLFKITGYKNTYFRSPDDLKKIIYPEDISVVEEHIAKIMSGKSDSEDFRIITKEGNICWINDNVRPELDQEGYVIRLIGAVKDITGRKSMEESYRTLVDNSIQGLVIFSGEKIVFANTAAYMITGYTAEELKMLTKNELQSLVYSEDREISAAISKNSLSLAHRMKSFEFRIVRRDGENRWIEVFPSPIGYRGGLALQYVFADITERKVAEEKFRKKSEEHEMLLNNIDLQVWYVYEKKIIGTVNKARELFLAKGKDAIENCSLYDLYDHEYAHKEFKKICEVHEKRSPVVSEEWHQNSFGEKRLLKISRTPKFDKSGRIEYVICTAADITEEKEREESIKDLIVALRVSKKMTEDRAEEVYSLNNKLTESEARLKELNASKDKFFSIISHDLRSPLNGLMGLSRVLSTEFESLSNEEIREFSESMHHSAENLYKLLENLLHWSRLQRGVINMEPAHIDVAGLCLMNKDLQNGSALQKGIEISVEIEESFYARADMNMINTVIRNLISNALKFTRRGGKIIVSAFMKGDKEICIYVKDNGVGMNSDTMSKIFRIDKVTTSEGTENEKGTGLGLILCKELVEKNGGRIWVDSVQGEGTTFYFTLPADN